MKLQQTKYSLVIVYILISIYLFGIALYFCLGSGSITSNYNTLKILPIFYIVGLMTICIINPRCIDNLFKIIILVLYGVRMCLVPWLIIMGKGYLDTRISTTIYWGIGLASSLQCYEFLWGLVLMVVLENPKFKYITPQFCMAQDFYITRRIRAILILLVVVSIGVVIRYPMLLMQFRPIRFSTEVAQLQWMIKNAAIKESVPKFTYYIVTWTLQLLKIVLVYYAIVIIKKLTYKKKRELLGIGLSLMAVATLLLITTDDKAASVYASIVMVLLLYKLYPGKRKLLIGSGIVGITFVIFGVFMVGVLDSDEGIHNLAKQLNIYFSGSINIAAALKMPRLNRFIYLKGDLLRSIPLAGGFFNKLPMTYLLFNQTLGVDPIYNSQVLPCVGQGYFYLGYLGAPIFPAILIIFGLNSYKKATYAKDSFGYFLYIYQAVFLCIGTVLYDFFLTLSLVMQYCVPFWVLYKLFLCRPIGEKDGV